MNEPLPQPGPQESSEPERLGFFGELRRRKVIRVAITYAVVAWLIIQVASATFEGFGIPEWAFRFVVLMLMLGFPIAVIITWAFELTPEGIKSTRVARVEQGDVPVTAAQQSKRNWLSFAFAAGFPTLIFGSLAIFFYFNRNGAHSPVDEKSIAVLPFTAFSTEQGEQFFADGLSDTLLHKLAQLSDLRVISRSSSFQYRGDAVDVRQVGEELNVATLLEGSVQRSGERLRIIAQLINTNDGSHIWSKTFDRTSQDTFAIQDEIADAVVSTLQIQLTPEERTRLSNSGTTSVQAYELLTALKERLNASRAFEREPAEFIAEINQLITETDRVLEIDPNYAEVYRFRADLHDSMIFVAGTRVDVSFHIRSGYIAVMQAMALEPDNPVNFAIYSTIARREGDYIPAEMFARLAYQKLPNSTDAISSLALSLMVQSKNYKEALELAQREQELNPNSSTFNWRRRTFALRGLGRTDEALEIIFEHTHNPNHYQMAGFDLRLLLSTVLGRHVETMKEMIRIRDQIGDDATEYFNHAWLFLLADVGAESEVFKWTEVPGYAIHAQVLLHFLRGEESAAIRLIEEKAPVFERHLATAYLAVGEFNTVVDLTLGKFEHLDSRKGKIPYLNDSTDLSAGLRLALSFQKTGQPEAAERLISAMDDYIQSRTYDGYFADSGYQLLYLALLKGEKTKALELLRKNVFIGEIDFVPLGSGLTFESPFFEALRGDDTFAAIVAEYGRRKSATASRITRMIQEAGY